MIFRPTASASRLSIKMEKYSIIERIKFSTFGKAFLLAAALTVFAGQTAAQKSSNQFAHLKNEHAAAVKNYIGTKKNLRPALRADCKNKFGLESLRQSAGNSAHPYYAAADFNRDKITDFAVVLYDSSQKTDERFTLLIFNGTKSGAYKLASTNAGMDLRQGGIWTYGFGSDDTKTSVTAGEYETDYCVWIEWEKGKYVTHDCAEAENAEGEQ